MIFVDTSALYAVLDRDDEHHPLAKSTWGTLLQGDDALIVTNYVMVETTALVQHRLGMQAVRVLCGDVLPARAAIPRASDPRDADASARGAGRSRAVGAAQATEREVR